MLYPPFYDPEKSYEENFEKGPFGVFAKKETWTSDVQVGLQCDFLGFKVNSPFGIPAGPLINGKFAQAALDKGFDIVTYKTVRSGKYPCHPWPNVLSVKVEGDLTLERAEKKLVARQGFSEPLSITNSFGVPSFDPKFWQKDLAKVAKNARAGQIVIGSFQGTKKAGQSVEEYVDDYRTVATMLLKTGVKVIEVNFSCPNEGTNNLLCYDVERSAKIARVIKEVIGDIPLIVKIAYYKDYDALRNFVKEVGSVAQGISAINTIAAEIVDENGRQALPGEGRLKSGVCGHAIKWAGIDMVKKLKKIRAEFGYSYTIIGVGGVMTPEDFFEYRGAGADFVMSATGAMWNPYLGRDVALEIKKRSARP